MSEEKETLLEKIKVIGTIFDFNIIFSEIFISEGTLSSRYSVHSDKPESYQGILGAQALTF